MTKMGHPFSRKRSDLFFTRRRQRAAVDWCWRSCHELCADSAGSVRTASPACPRRPNAVCKQLISTQFYPTSAMFYTGCYQTVPYNLRPTGKIMSKTVITIFFLFYHSIVYLVQYVWLLCFCLCCLSADRITQRKLRMNFDDIHGGWHKWPATIIID